MRRVHNRPQKCVAPGCDSKGFATLSELNRRINALHTVLHIFCPVASCNRSENAGQKKTFKRKDHLQEHLRRKHPEFKGPKTRLFIEPPIDTSVSSPTPSPPLHLAKRKRHAQDDGEDMYQSLQGVTNYAQEIRQLKHEHVRLRESKDKECHELRARISWLEDNNKILTQVVDRMSKEKV